MDSAPTLLFPRKLAKEARAAVRSFAKQLAQDLAPGRAFTCLITGDARLRQLNREFLGQDYPTDVLSFPAVEDGELGEIAISLDRAGEQAAEFGHAVEMELKILLLHGLLHLLGHDHEKDRGAMRRLETKLRKRYGLAPGLIERTRK
jgi:probable rRNA maturation factor